MPSVLRLPPKSSWASKTEFQPLAGGRMRRRVARRDGTVEKDEVIGQSP